MQNGPFAGPGAYGIVRPWLRRGVVRAILAAVAAIIVIGTRAVPTSARQSVPERLTDREFWSMVTEFSEPGGTFHADNFTSNEQFANVAADLAAGGKGGAYLGVGPEQNFNYILAIEPAIAFIVDIRRQAVLHHLSFKALFELSDDRAAFLARLFSRPRPAGPADQPLQKLWDAVTAAEGDPAALERTLADVERQLTKVHGFALSPDDLASIRYVHEAFFKLGPSINYGGYRAGLSTGGLDFMKLSASVDRKGVARSFLASEGSYRKIRTLQERNLIIPVEADFAGPKGIRAIGDYLRRHRTLVSAFYISNVEQYLYGISVARETDINGGWRAFYANAATLPMDDRSVFVRGPLGSMGSGVARGSTIQPQRMLCPMRAFLAAVDAGKVQSQADARRCVV
jgi:hypothetical protein